MKNEYFQTRILYIKGFRAIDGRDGGFLMKSYGDADTMLTTFQQFPRWE